MEEKTGGLIFIFIFIILGVVLVGILADNIYEAVNPLTSHNETLDIESLRYDPNNNINETIGLNVTVVTAGDTVTSVSSIKMENGTAFTVTTDYIANFSGDKYIYFKNTTALVNYTNNNTYVTYGYQGENYIVHSTSRTLINLITVFFVIAILIFVIFFIKKKYIDKI